MLGEQGERGGEGWRGEQFGYAGGERNRERGLIGYG
jgi:hypothetical protein